MNGMCPRQRGYWLQHNECPIITEKEVESLLLFHRCSLKPLAASGWSLKTVTVVYAFIKYGLMHHRISLPCLTVYVIVGFQLVGVRSGVWSSPGALFFWNSPGAKPDHQNNAAALNHTLHKSLTSFGYCQNLRSDCPTILRVLALGPVGQVGNPTQNNSWKDEALMVFICSR